MKLKDGKSRNRKGEVEKGWVRRRREEF